MAPWARDRPASANASNKGANPPGGIAPELRPSRAVMGLRVRGIRVLVRTARTRNLFSKAVRNVFIVFGRLVSDATWADHDLGTVCAQQAAFLLADLIGHDKDTMVPFERGGQGQAMSGVATGRLNDSPTWPQQTKLLTALNQRWPNAVFHAPTGIKHLHFGQNQRGYISGDMIEPHERRIAHQLEDIIVIM